MAKSKAREKNKMIQKTRKHFKRTNNSKTNKYKFINHKNIEENSLLPDTINNNNFNLNFSLLYQNFDTNLFNNDPYYEPASEFNSNEILSNNKFKFNNSNLYSDINQVIRNKNIQAIKNQADLDNNKFHCDICSKKYKRKEYLKKHVFFSHSNYKGMNCIYCGKHIIRITDHIKICQLKSKINKSKSDNKKCLTSQNDKDFKIQTFTELFNIYSEQSKKNETISLMIKEESSIKVKNIIYYLNYSIGNGGNMRVFYGKDIKSGQEFAVKIDTNNKNHTIVEGKIINSLQDINKIPKIYFYEYMNNKSIIAETLFGPSLKKFFLNGKEIFESALVTLIGKQVIEILSNIHKKGIIHNDIKPNNICWAKIFQSHLVDKSEFFLIDFGYARKYGEFLQKRYSGEQNPNNGFYHYEDKLENKFTGTPEYMAIPISDGYCPSRRTDIEELMYTLIFLLNKSLPWQTIKSKTHTEKCKRMGEAKKQINIKKLFDNCPNEYIDIYKSIRKLKFKEKPNYDLYINVFNSILNRFGILSEEIQKKFIKVKFDKFLKLSRSSYLKNKFSSTIESPFSGYPIVI